MSDIKATLTEYAEEILATPRAHLSLELHQEDAGVTLFHSGKALVHCPLSTAGMAAASFMAQALGVPLPPLGQSVQISISTGLLYRVLTIASLDFDIEESFIILERLLEEAELQRRGASASE